MYFVKLDVWRKLCSRSDANYWKVIAKLFHSDFIKQQCYKKQSSLNDFEVSKEFGCHIDATRTLNGNFLKV